MAVPFNELQNVNGSLVNLAKNTVNVPHTGRIPLVAGTDSTVYSFYATENNILNAITGQTEISQGLIIN